jgi:hypothetical protein
MIRRAIVATQKGGTVSRFLPSNYKVVGDTGAPDHFTIIEGEDYAGWTLDDYVIPRLASGLYACREVPAEKMYLVHHQCGEAFDSLETAVQHACTGSEQTLWELLPESEAM